MQEHLILDQTIDSIKKNIPEDAFIIIDVNVEHLCRLELPKERVWRVSNPEESKNFTNLEEGIQFFLEHHITRQDDLWVIGGGATLDLGGLVAALLLRGITWKAVPTTLLAQVDACLGGKVAINSILGKNLIGHFYPAKEIYLSVEWLRTLPPKEKLSGVGEIIKYAMIDHAFYQMVLGKEDMIDSEVIKACLHFKQNIVAQDPKEKGLRKILNLGHTFGHALERCLPLPHGLAVVFGMEILFTSFQERDLLTKLSSLKKKLQIPKLELSNIDPEVFWSYVSKDKKRDSAQRIQLVFPDQKSLLRLEKIELSELRKKVGSLYASLA